MVICNAEVSASDGGLAGRQDTRIAENLYVVGDWVGKEGLLSNASVASAKRASELISEKLTRFHLNLNNLFYMKIPMR